MGKKIIYTFEEKKHFLYSTSNLKELIESIIDEQCLELNENEIIGIYELNDNPIKNEDEYQEFLKNEDLKLKIKIEKKDEREFLNVLQKIDENESIEKINDNDKIFEENDEKNNNEKIFEDEQLNNNNNDKMFEDEQLNNNNNDKMFEDEQLNNNNNDKKFEEEKINDKIFEDNVNDDSNNFNIIKFENEDNEKKNKMLNNSLFENLNKKFDDFMKIFNKEKEIRNKQIDDLNNNVRKSIENLEKKLNEKNNNGCDNDNITFLNNNISNMISQKFSWIQNTLIETIINNNSQINQYFKNIDSKINDYLNINHNQNENNNNNNFEKNLKNIFSEIQQLKNYNYEAQLNNFIEIIINRIDDIKIYINSQNELLKSEINESIKLLINSDNNYKKGNNNNSYNYNNNNNDNYNTNYNNNKNFYQNRNKNNNNNNNYNNNNNNNNNFHKQYNTYYNKNNNKEKIEYNKNFNSNNNNYKNNNNNQNNNNKPYKAEIKILDNKKKPILKDMIEKKETINLEIKNTGNLPLPGNCYIKGDSKDFFIKKEFLGNAISVNSSFNSKYSIMCKNSFNPSNIQDLEVVLCDSEGNKINSLKIQLEIQKPEEDSSKFEFNSKYINEFINDKIKKEDENKRIINENEYEKINKNKNNNNKNNNYNIFHEDEYDEDENSESSEFMKNLNQLQEFFGDKNIEELKNALKKSKGDYEKALDNLIGS